MRDFISLNEAREIIPGRPSIETMRRWEKQGVRGRKLKTLLRGGRRFVSRAAILEFLDLDAASLETFGAVCHAS